MTNEVRIADLNKKQQELFNSLRIPNQLLSRLKNVSDDQKNTIQDVLALIYPSAEDKDFGAKSIMSINVAILSTVIEDLVKNFNFNSNFYISDAKNHKTMIDALCNVVKTQTQTMTEMKKMSMVGAPQLHIHQHARGIPSFHDDAVVIIDGIPA